MFLTIDVQKIAIYDAWRSGSQVLGTQERMKSNAQSGNSQDRPKKSSGAQPRTVMGRACFSQNNIHDEGIGVPQR